MDQERTPYIINANLNLIRINITMISNTQLSFYNNITLFYF